MQYSNKNTSKILKELVNKKGQAAATDAIIFLSIVAVVFVLILGYAMTYGLGVLDSTKKLYINNYHYAALKSFLSASYGRDGNDPLFLQNGVTPAFPVTDSVATMIKEDYGANGQISLQTQKAVFGVLDELFLPMPQRSYLLLLTHEVTDIYSVLSPLIVFLRGVDAEGKNEYYVCFPESNDKIEQFLANHSLDLQVVEGPFIFYRNILTSSIKKETGQIFLASWVSAYNASGKLSEEDLLKDLNCNRLD